ncbi:NAD(P)H-dependent oxidoreductase subunit E [bacterium]|nr:NAD(P)H-dependent oxidoreductase subunit E [bacterium]
MIHRLAVNPILFYFFTSDSNGTGTMNDTLQREQIEKQVDEILSHYTEVQGNLISIMHEIQTLYHYLPKEPLRVLADRTGFTMQRLYSIATFYNHFSLEPRGKHEVHICTGTACHVKGAPRLVDELERELGIKEGQTTEDMNFSLHAVRCVGACSLAPVVLVDGITLGGATPKSLTKLLNKLRKEDETEPSGGNGNGKQP